MKFLLEQDYNNMNFLWIMDYYDIHFSGLCYQNNEICYFKINTENIYDSDLKCNIYLLTKYEKFKLLLSKKLFEMCITKSWTYPYCNNSFDTLLMESINKNNKIINKIMFTIYYKFFSRLNRIKINE
jgi:hypothetical protein